MAPSISFPPSGSVAIETLDGSNWRSWSSRITALMRMNGLKKHITDTKDSNDTEWDSKEEIILGVLEMYCQKDIWTTVTDDSVNSKVKTCKEKWEKLMTALMGESGLCPHLTPWVALTSTALDDSAPMLPQLQKLLDACLTLENNDMKVSDLQYCFILIKALRDTYSAVASTILASDEPKDLSPQKIQDRILNEEGRRSGASTSANKIAPIKRKGDKADKSKIKCYYCQKRMGTKVTSAAKRKRTLRRRRRTQSRHGQR